MKVKGVYQKPAVLATFVVVCCGVFVAASWGNEWVGVANRGEIILASGSRDLQLEERLAPGTGLVRPSSIPAAPEPTLAPPRHVGGVNDGGTAAKIRISPEQSGDDTLIPAPLEEADSEAGNEIVFDESLDLDCFGEGEIIWDESCYDGWNICQPDQSIWDLRWGRIGYLSINLGTTGFTNALDLGANSNFGFSEGFNFSMPISPQNFISGQVGFRGVQTNLTGTAFGTGHRNQTYITAGVFLRNDMSRFQAGVVYDWLQDDFHRNIKLEQLRTEISFRTWGQYEFGFQGTHDMSGEVNALLPIANADDIDMSVRPLDCYSLFIRKNMIFGGIGTISGGTTQQGGGLLGAKYEIPINDRFYISSQVAMYIPKEGRGAGGQEKETWGIGIDLVWSFRGGVMSRQCQRSRPMFDVADATTFFTAVRR